MRPLFALFLLLAACTPAPVQVTVLVPVTLTPLPSATHEPTPSPTPEIAPSATFTPNPPTEEATPTRETVQLPLDCDSLVVSDGFYPVNYNPCLIGKNYVSLNPPDSRVQCIANGFTAIWQRYSDNTGFAYPAPFVFCEANGGMKVDIGNQAGTFGLAWNQHNLARGLCYLLKLVVTTDVNGSANMQNLYFSGSMYSSAQSGERLLSRQSLPRQDGRAEFIWPFIAPYELHIRLQQTIVWPEYSGVVIWDSVEIFPAPGYCENGAVRFE
jgi:hypothetical protein